jgi:signal transduction histidine kinase
MIDGSYQPRPWHLLIVLILFVGFEQVLEWTYLQSVRQTALHAADTAQEAALSRLLNKGPISARRDVVLAGDEIVDPGELEKALEGAHGWRVHVGTSGAACPAPGAERTVLVERTVFRGIAPSRDGTQILRCDPLRDRYGEVVGVIAVAAPEAMFVHGLGRFRLVAGLGLVTLLSGVGLLGWALSATQAEEQRVKAVLAEHQANTEAAADLLRRQKESLDAQLAQAAAERDEAVSTETSRSAFLLALSEELRSRFDRLIEHAQRVLPDTEGETTREARQILDWSRALRASIDDLHDAVALETGQITLEPEVFDIEELLSELALAATRALSLGGNTLTLTQPGNLGQMRADRRRVRQVLANLLSNAAKYTRDGQIELCVEALEDDTLRFEVRDDGIGMDPVQTVRIFDAFVRFDASEHVHGEHAGLGLGLTVVRGLVEQMGGVVHVQSELGVGSTFTVLLPRDGEREQPDTLLGVDRRPQ